MTATNENKYTHQPPATAEELAKQILLIGVRYSFKTEGTIAHAEEAKKEVAALITAHVAQVTAEWQLQADLAEPTIKSLSNEVAVLCTICAKQKEALILGDAIVIAQALALTPATVADELATLQKRLHAAGESCSNYIAEINSLGDELAAKDKRIAELDQHREAEQKHTDFWVYEASKERARAEAAEAKVKELEKNAEHNFQAALKHAEAAHQAYRDRESAEAKVKELEQDYSAANIALENALNEVKQQANAKGETV